MRRSSEKIQLLALLLCFLTTTFSLNAKNADDLQMRKVIGDITKIYMSSMVYIFANQPLINQKGGDKSELQGQKFINNVMQTYQSKYNEEFPQQEHFTQRMLLQAMIEVMDANKELLNDSEIGFKGLIPATFAFQLSAKLATKGLGLKIKFTTLKEGVRNVLNRPDEWESKTMKQMLEQPKIFYDNDAMLNGMPAFRQFTPLPMAPFCLACHGKPSDNPLNFGKDKAQWSNIDMTGLPMENWTIEDFGGGVSISIEKSILQQ